MNVSLMPGRFKLKKTSVTVVVLLALLSIGTLGVILNGKLAAANPPIIVVPTESATIQEAINMANEGDIIKVKTGTYRENVVVDKSIALIGDGKNVTFIEGNRVGAVVTVRANNVNISGFSIQNGTKGVSLQGSNMSTISNNIMVSNNAQGVHLNSSHGNKLTNNTISLNGFEGIFIQNSSNNLVGDNVVTNNKHVGIDLLYSNSNRISNNTVTFHGNVSLHEQGIWFESSNNNTIDENIILNNAWGIDAYICDNNTVYGNIISNNHHGVDLDEYSNNNTFYHNNFVNNTHQAESYQSLNRWDNGTQGNYWSDYREKYPNATEIDGSGIWDTPYLIDENNLDRYPLMNRWSPPVKDITPPVTTDDYDSLWHNQDFVITLVTEDFSGINATYYRINQALPFSNVSADGQPFITIESTNNTLEYWSVDNASNEEKPHKILTEIKLDKTVPYGSVLINNNDDIASSSSVMLNLFGNDTLSGISQMRFSNDEHTWTLWETYTTTKTWNLTLGDGLKTVYVQFMDNAGLVSQSYHDTIILDAAAPTVSILSPSEGSEIKSSEVTIQWNGTDAGSGIDHYELRLDGGSWINRGTEQTYTLTGLSDGSHTVYVKAFDKIGRSQESSVRFIVNTTPLGGPGYIDEAILLMIIATGFGAPALYFFKIRKRKSEQKTRHVKTPSLYKYKINY